MPYAPRYHIDAAYAGVAALLPEQAPMFEGLDRYGDSFVANMHKSLLVNFDCSALWVADAPSLRVALGASADILTAKANSLDYKVRRHRVLHRCT